MTREEIKFLLYGWFGFKGELFKEDRIELFLNDLLQPQGEAEALRDHAAAICKRCKESKAVPAFAICEECACKFIEETKGEVQKNDHQKEKSE